MTQLFMKIDANSDGSVSWDEFSTFVVMVGGLDQDYSVRCAIDHLQVQGRAFFNAHLKSTTLEIGSGRKSAKISGFKSQGFD
jgi:hypothetical protein